MKRKFEIELVGRPLTGTISIAGYDNMPFVRIDVDGRTYTMNDNDLETFAINLLKALKSKKLAA